MGGVTFRPLEPIYVKDGDKLKLPTYLYRLDKKGLRFYFHKKQRSNKYFLSATSFGQISLPTSPHLVEWKVNMGDDAEQYTREAADYGTFSHDVLLNFALTQEIDLSQTRVDLLEFLEKNHHSFKLVDEWMYRLEYDLIAWSDFCQIHDVQVIAIEYPVYGWNAFRIAGSIDLVCRLRIEEWGNFGETYKRATSKNKAGDPKQTKGWVYYNAIVDIKTGRKAFYESHEFQLANYHKIWNKHFENVFRVEKVFNWRPKDWRSKESASKFAIKDQTDSPFRKVIMDYYHIARKMGYLEPNLKSLVVNDKLNLRQPISEQFKILRHEEYIRAVHKGKAAANRII